MENQEIYLTKDVLGNLNLRVVKSLSYLKLLDNDTLWDKPLALCQRIESNIREVDDVILEVQKEKRYFMNTTNNPLCSQITLTLAYIILYYRHCDDELYKVVVFPILQKNMGIFSEQLLNDIQNKVKKVLEIDRLIEQSKQEKKKNIKPKYSFIHLSSAEADEYFSEFCDETLFNSFSDILEVMKSQYFNKIDVAEIWLTAKDVVQKLWQEKCPENFIDRIYHKLSLSAGTGYVEKGAAEAVLLCAYAMMRTVNKSDHFSNAIEYMENIPNGDNDYDLLYHYILSTKQIMDNNVSSFVDYDYTGGAQKPEELFSKADVERMMQNKNEQIEQMKKEWADREAILKDENKQQLDENTRMKEEIDELRKHEPVQELKPLNTNEKIIFFSTVLNVAYESRFTNQKALSEFICLICGGSPTTFQPRISDFSDWENKGKTEEIQKAAKKIVDKLNKIPKGGDKDNPKIKEIIDSIRDEFQVE